jgi:hypothetical protein
MACVFVCFRVECWEYLAYKWGYVADKWRKLHSEELHKICAVLGYYAASCGNPLPTFRNNVSVPSSRVKTSKKKNRQDYAVYLGDFLTLEYGIDTLSRNVGKGLPLDAA